MSTSQNTLVYLGPQGDNLVVKAGGVIQLLAGAAIIGASNVARATVTLAQVNAGLTLIPGIAGHRITVTGGYAISTGGFAALTAIEIQESDAVPVIISLAQAQLTDGARFNFRSVITGQTIGAGFNVALTAGLGVRIIRTGSAGTTATSIDIILDYIVEAA